MTDTHQGAVGDARKRAQEAASAPLSAEQPSEASPEVPLANGPQTANHVVAREGLTDDERERLAGNLRWHFGCHVAEPERGYDSLGIENAILRVTSILATHTAALSQRLAEVERQSAAQAEVIERLEARLAERGEA